MRVTAFGQDSGTPARPIRLGKRICRNAAPGRPGNLCAWPLFHWPENPTGIGPGCDVAAGTRHQGWPRPVVPDYWPVDCAGGCESRNPNAWLGGFERCGREPVPDCERRYGEAEAVDAGAVQVLRNDVRFERESLHQLRPETSGAGFNAGDGSRGRGAGSRELLSGVDASIRSGRPCVREDRRIMLGLRRSPGRRKSAARRPIDRTARRRGQRSVNRRCHDAVPARRSPTSGRDVA